MKHPIAYKYRCYPTGPQQDLLAKTFGCCRFVYNYMLKFRTNSYYQGKRVGFVTTCKELTKTKALPDHIWLNDVSSVALQQSLRNLQKAFDGFFAKRTQYPSFKKKGHAQSATFTVAAFRFDPGTRRLWLAKTSDPLKIRWSRKLPFLPKSITISQDLAGRYFVSFHGEMDIQPLPPSEKAVGIDMGLTHFAITSDGVFISPPKCLRQYQSRLKMLQQRLSRRKQGGKNWQKTKHQIARLHVRIADARKDFIHKFTTSVIREYGHVITEDLGVINMLKNHCLAEAISDAAWSEAFRQLGYKSDWYQRIYTQINRFFPSSKRCHVCGHILDHLDLSTRSWTCPICSTVHNRDLNAALNILAAGLAVVIYGQGVRLQKENLSGASPCVVTTS